MSDGVIPFNSMDGAEYLAGGESPEREEELLNGGGIYDFYRCSDGGYMSVGSLEPKFYGVLCDTLGLSDWRDVGYLSEHQDEVKTEFRRIFETKTRDEWVKIFEGVDACVEPVLSLEKAACDVHLKEREMWPEVPFYHDPSKHVRQPGCPIKMSKTPPEYKYAGLPDGYNTEEVIHR